MQLTSVFQYFLLLFGLINKLLNNFRPFMTLFTLFLVQKYCVSFSPFSLRPFPAENW